MEPFAVIILLLAAAMLAKVIWPIFEGIFKSILEMIKTLLVLGAVGFVLFFVAQALGG